MVRRKGELTKAAVDRDWPHQVALPTPISHVAQLRDFCRAERLSLCQRTTGFYRTVDRETIWFACFCFATRADAEQFQARFGGEFIDPKDRPKWPGPQAAPAISTAAKEVGAIDGRGWNTIGKRWVQRQDAEKSPSNCVRKETMFCSPSVYT